MKKSRTQSRKHTLAIYPPDHTSAAAADKDQLTDLVWKYFAEEITEALMEVQEALAPEEKGSSRQVRHQKG